ncbi:MAG TPA: hypothetical protein GXX14_01055 [Clostridiaceae bacterium]|nr:hypothetical protein [Clostridiaceae bacterium]
MKSRLFLSAVFRLRNIGILLIALGIAAILENNISGANVFAYPAAIAVYIVSILQSLVSRKFHEKFNQREKIRNIQNLNFACLRLSHEAKKHTNPRYAQKLRKVMEDKDDIVNSFFRGERSYLKEKIVEQTLNLVVSYIKLLTNFCIRNRELSEIDVGAITNRINQNLRKLNFVNDPVAAEDLKKVIEMDEKIIKRVKEEKQELERIGAKLDYMESTVHMFKHQIISSIESEEMLETLETAVNEAAALDSVLEERRKSRIRI